ncbi:hypothetical protein DVH05_027247 [Phytophthora capsici]|nr:hypothetical protein DVH05_027247 [Phytophthora capsici]
MRGEVAEFDASVHTSAKAAAGADALYKASEGRMGTDETTFINIPEHVRSINSAYVSKYKTSVQGCSQIYLYWEYLRMSNGQPKQD